MDDKAAGTSTAPHHSTTGQPLPLDDLSQQVEAMSLLAPSTGGEGQQKEEEGAAEAKGGGKSKKKKKVSGSERRRRQREKAEADPRLPPELVYHILDLVVEEVTAIWAGQVGEERRRLLRTACLVCSLWRDEAQKLLWKTVFLTSNAGLRSFSLTDKQPKVLVFNEPESAPRLDGQLVGAVLEKVRGVKRLKVDGIDGFSPAWICNDRFADLQHLVLTHVIRYLPSAGRHQRRLQFPFRLQSLDFCYHWTPASNPFALINSLLEVAVGYVGLPFDGRPPFAFTCATAATISDKPIPLTTLMLAGPPSIAKLLFPFLRCCMSLKNFEFMAAPTPALLQTIPSRRLDVVVNRPPDHLVTPAYKYTDELNCVRGGYPCLSKLQTLRVLNGGDLAALKILKNERRGIALDVRNLWDILERGHPISGRA